MTKFFTRDGREYEGTVTIEPGKTSADVVKRINCIRCGGVGGSPHWPGFTCYRCGGAKTEPYRFKIYTAEKLEKLIAAQAKRDAKKEAKRLQEMAERAAAKEAFLAASPELAAAFNLIPKADGVDVVDSYAVTRLRDLEHNLWKYGSLSDAQIEFALSLVKQEQEKAEKVAASKHIASVGERIEDVAVVEGVARFDKPDFVTGRLVENYAITLRLDNGAALVYMGPAWFADKGEKIRFAATVKEHSEYKGEKQTRIMRVKVKETIEAQGTREGASL